MQVLLSPAIMYKIALHFVLECGGYDYVTVQGLSYGFLPVACCIDGASGLLDLA